MSLLNPRVVGSSVSFNMEECVSQGKSLRQEYVDASPFPHIMKDDFLPQDLLNRVVDEFPSRLESEIADAHSQYKTGYILEDICSVYITNLLSALNSAQFLRFLEEMTSIEGLISDPYYTGGGLHETARNGHLSIHADFNLQQKLKLIRRLNLILFLNEGWIDAYGGQLELWNRDMSGCAKSVLPMIGRAVVFNTDEDSYHGHPDPLKAPEGVFRRSIALYYYTSPAEKLDRIRVHSTQFRVRSGSADHFDYKTKLYEACRDLCPPILWRWAASRKNMVTKPVER